MRAVALLALGLAALSTPSFAQQAGRGTSPYVRAANTGITEVGLRNYLTFIASDALQGRDTPSPGLDAAAEFIAFHLRRWGYLPGGDAGSYFQRITLSRSTLDPAKTIAALDGRALRYEEDFSPGAYVGSGSAVGRGTAKGGLVYVGHGIQWKAKGVDPYAGLDLKGKLLLVNGKSPDLPWRDGTAGKDYFSVVQVASREGAAGVVVLSTGDPDVWKLRARGTAQMQTRAGGFQPTDPAENKDMAPLVTVSPTVSEELLTGSGLTLADAMAEAQQPKGRALSGGKALEFTVTRNIERRYTQNVVAIWPGADPKLRGEYVALGAHYDHVGARTGPDDGRDRIFNGADDDGSGTTALLGIAGAVAAGPRPKRSTLFVWHCGEEKGLWGSEYFTDHPTVPIQSIVTQLNIDMIGRSKKPGDTNPRNAELSGPDEIYVIGSKMLSTELGRISEQVNAGYEKLSLNYRYDDPKDPNRFYYRSDHYNYARKGIPIIFYFDGVHEDYHGAGDEVSKIDFSKMLRITRTVYLTLAAVADRPTRPKVDGRARE